MAVTAAIQPSLVTCPEQAGIGLAPASAAKAASERSRPTPAGLEDLFRELGNPGVEMDPATLPALAARYGCKVDFEGTATIIGRHGLQF